MSETATRQEVWGMLGDLDAAAAVLARPGPSSLESAGQRLASVDLRLRDLVTELGSVASAEANGLLRARTDLSVHLSAALTLHDEGLHRRAAAVLEGAIATARARLDGCLAP